MDSETALKSVLVVQTQTIWDVEKYFYSSSNAAVD